MLEFLPERIRLSLRYLNLNRLYELRMRADKPLTANFEGKYCYLGASGIVSVQNDALIPTREEVEQTLFAASDYSVYAVENQIKEGFVTGKCGERIGIAGAFVYEHGKPLSIRAVTSLCIRIPHTVEGCAEEIYRRCFTDGVCSLLILSPPALGKTTLLRDLTRLVSVRTKLNVLVSDERGELSAGDMGASSDIIRFADKLTAFTAGIRAMRPDIIVTDELLPKDYAAVRRAIESGIFVFASAHLTKYDAVPEKLFHRYITLCGVGEIDRIYGADGEYVD